MSARLSKRVRQQLLNELGMHDRYQLKAIGARHGVSRQTLSLLRAERVRKPLRGKMPTAPATGHFDHEASLSPESTTNMTNDEMRNRIAELERRADAFTARSVELLPEAIAALEIVAAERGTTRDAIARWGLREWMIAMRPELFRAESNTNH
jgi:hypothetical protein